MDKEQANRLSQITIVIAILSYRIHQLGYEKHFLKPEFIVEVLKKIYLDTTVEEVESMLNNCDSAYTKSLGNRGMVNTDRENGIMVSYGAINIINSVDIQPQHLTRIPFLY